MKADKFDIVVFLVSTTTLIIVLAGLIMMLTYFYQKKQVLHRESLKSLKLGYEKSLLATQLEIQETTFQEISREIHDNINLSLTLAKLHLNTLNLDDRDRSTAQIGTAIKLISESITNLSDISKSLNSDIVSSQGLMTAIKEEVGKIAGTGVFKVEFDVLGEPVYLEEDRELIIFRIVQEALNNTLKHANATAVDIFFHYEKTSLKITVKDNGKGFNVIKSADNGKLGKAGLSNMEARTRMLKGSMVIDALPGNGTKLEFHIPYT
jgi:two-component system NarL family sensor kinase